MLLTRAVCERLHLLTCIDEYIYIHTCMTVWLHTYIHMRLTDAVRCTMRVCMYVCMRVCVHACMRACVYVIDTCAYTRVWFAYACIGIIYTCTYIHTHTVSNQTHMHTGRQILIHRDSDSVHPPSLRHSQPRLRPRHPHYICSKFTAKTQRQATV